MRDLLGTLGYQIDYHILSDTFRQMADQEPPHPVQRAIEAFCPYAVLAYQQGLEGNPLSDMFPFLVLNGKEEIPRE